MAVSGRRKRKGWWSLHGSPNLKRVRLSHPPAGPAVGSKLPLFELNFLQEVDAMRKGRRRWRRL